MKKTKKYADPVNLMRGYVAQYESLEMRLKQCGTENNNVHKQNKILERKVAIAIPYLCRIREISRHSPSCKQNKCSTSWCPYWLADAAIQLVLAKLHA